MKIVASDSMEAEVLEKIKAFGSVVYKPADLNKEIADADVLIVRSATKVTKELLANANQLKMVIRGGVGLDNVDKDACKEKGVKVLNTPGASSNAVAELVVGLMVSLMRNVVKGHDQVKAGVWDRKMLTGKEIQGKTLGLIGLGRIGGLVAEKARALGMNIIAFDKNVSNVNGVKMVGSPDEIFAHADVISLHVPATGETIGMINKQSIAKMKDGVYIINTSRGAVINEADLSEALTSGKIAGAALDVTAKEPPEGPILQAPNVIFSSHVGASSIEAQLRIGGELVKLLEENFAK
ncbi:3-phosphoglycerate dehydrogenase [Candidatus Micrarchaeota archaeon]|nr:3-phosphoglycerate dehydrogenase [Candidatus Micrarchaeota archaeon]